jgi:hypothetical protein
MPADDVAAVTPPPPPPQQSASAGPSGPPTPPAAAADAKSAAPPGKDAPKFVPVSPDQLPIAGEGEPQEPSIHRGFFQQPWVQDLLPLITSLAFHATIVVVGLLAYQTYKAVAAVKPNEEQVIIPEAAMASEIAGGVENPGLDGDPTRPAAQDKYEDNTHPDGWAPEPGKSPVAEATGGGEADSKNSLFAAGPAASFGSGKGFGSGEGDGNGNGSGTGKGRLAAFGPTGGGIPGPRGKVFGEGGNARTIAFTCDASGSMIPKFGLLRRELQKAIDGLRHIQRFSITFYADKKAIAFENGNLVYATDENKRKAAKWLDDIFPSGQTDPLPSLDIAFKGKPDLLYMLTDGEFDNNKQVMDRVAALNKDRRTRVNTIAFIDKEADRASDTFIKFLTALADQNGGKFKQVTTDQLD